MKKFGTFGRKLKAHKSEVDKLEANPQLPLTPKKSFTSLRRKLKDRCSMADIPDRFIFLPIHMAPEQQRWTIENRKVSNQIINGI
jgi:hypothetical protein